MKFDFILTRCAISRVSKSQRDWNAVLDTRNAVPNEECIVESAQMTSIETRDLKNRKGTGVYADPF